MPYPKWTEDKVERWIAEGRGQGVGPGYKPWLTVRDVPKRGRRHRPFSQKFGRELQLFSDVEFGVFLLAEHSPKVTEAEEQRPIDRSLSQDMASAIGIRHPYFQGTKVPTVMTVDLLVTLYRRGRQIKVGVDAKTKDQLDSPRVLEKLHLTKLCLAEEGHEHVIVCDSHLPKPLIHNLVWIRSACPHKEEILPYPNYLEEAADRLLQHLPYHLCTTKRLNSLCEEFDSLMGWEPDTALRAARFLLHTHRLKADLRSRNLAALPMEQFSLPEPITANVAAGAA